MTECHTPDPLKRSRAAESLGPTTPSLKGSLDLLAAATPGTGRGGTKHTKHTAYEPARAQDAHEPKGGILHQLFSQAPTRSRTPLAPPPVPITVGARLNLTWSSRASPSTSVSPLSGALPAAKAAPLTCGATMGGSRSALKRRPQSAARVSAVEGISKHELKRCARRGGVKRISPLVMVDARAALRDYLSDVVCRAVIYAQHSHR
jgi:histone H3/H4